MIRNIIFDMGNVLLTFNPDSILDRFVTQEENKEPIRQELFNGEEWPLLDRGALTEEEALDRVLARLPESAHEDARQVMAHWDEAMPLLDEMYHLVKELKLAGYGVYLLSNASLRFHQYAKRIPAFHWMDGLLISADVQAVKPEPAIYEKLFFTYYLRPEQCLFIDDLPQNIEGGKALGMDGIVFDGNMTHLREALQKRGVTVETQTQFIPVETPQQIVELSRLAHEIWNQHFVPIIGQEQVNYMLARFQSRSALTRQLEREGYRYYFLQYEGANVGYVGLKIEDGALFLSKLYVRELFRGKKIAKKAVNFLVSLAEQNGCSKIWLTVNRHNDNTIAAYEKMGFQTVREQASDIGEGFIMDDYIMEKPVKLF